VPANRTGGVPGDEVGYLKGTVPDVHACHPGDRRRRLRRVRHRLSRSAGTDVDLGVAERRGNWRNERLARQRRPNRRSAHRKWCKARSLQGSRQVGNVALEIPLAPLALGRGRQCDDPRRRGFR
jgi:hypothetical protein